MDSMKLVIPLHSLYGQFAPKMKANAEPRLLSSLVRIDLALWCHSIVWSLFFMEFMIILFLYCLIVFI